MRAPRPARARVRTVGPAGLTLLAGLSLLAGLAGGALAGLLRVPRTGEAA